MEVGGTMSKRLEKSEISQHGPYHETKRRFLQLLSCGLLIELLLWAAVLFGPVTASGLLVVLIVFGPPYTVYWDWNCWVVILALVLVGPLYYLRRYVNRRLDEVRYQLEQVGPSDPSQEERS